MLSQLLRVVQAARLRLVREQIIVDGNFLAAPTTFSGDFTGLFTYSPSVQSSQPGNTSSGK